MKLDVLRISKNSRGWSTLGQAHNVSVQCAIYKFVCLFTSVFVSSFLLFVFVEVLQPNRPNGVMLRGVSLPNYTFTGQA